MKSKKLPVLQELEEKIIELTEALQRERADAVNLRRRAEEDKLQAANFYKATVVRDILPIVDNCERLLDHISTHSKGNPWKQGVEQIVKQCQKTLDDLGVERIKTVGEHFNPHLHEAIHMDDGDPSTSSTRSTGAQGRPEQGRRTTGSPQAGSGQAADWHEVVSQELQAGYKIGDEVIRPAMVKVKKENK